MAECAWAVLCDHAFLDAAGKMCLIGIFDRFNVKTVPTIHPKASIVVQLRGEPKEAIHFKVEIVRPGGSTLWKAEGEGEASEAGGAGLQLTISPLQLPDYGPYACNVFVNDQLSYIARFEVGKASSGAPS